MGFWIVISLGLALAGVYLLRQWYTGELADALLEPAQAPRPLRVPRHPRRAGGGRLAKKRWTRRSPLMRGPEPSRARMARPVRSG